MNTAATTIQSHYRGKKLRSSSQEWMAAEKDQRRAEDQRRRQQQERQRAEEERRRAEAQRQRAEAEQQRMDAAVAALAETQAQIAALRQELHEERAQKQQAAAAKAAEAELLHATTYLVPSPSAQQPQPLPQPPQSLPQQVPTAGMLPQQTPTVYEPSPPPQPRDTRPGSRVQFQLPVGPPSMPLSARSPGSVGGATALMQPPFAPNSARGHLPLSPPNQQRPPSPFVEQLSAYYAAAAQRCAAPRCSIEPSHQSTLVVAGCRAERQARAIPSHVWTELALKETLDSEWPHNLPRRWRSDGASPGGGGALGAGLPAVRKWIGMHAQRGDHDDGTAGAWRINRPPDEALARFMRSEVGAAPELGGTSSLIQPAARESAKGRRPAEGTVDQLLEHQSRRHDALDRLLASRTTSTS